MNMNQQNNQNNGGGSHSFPPGQQQYPGASGPQHPSQQGRQPPQQRTGMPMQLPPQLANLTPEQIQQLRSQPQFQQLLRNYMQRQMFQQQQQQPGGQGNSNNMPQQMQQASGPQSQLPPQQRHGPGPMSMHSGQGQGQGQGQPQGQQAKPMMGMAAAQMGQQPMSGGPIRSQGVVAPGMMGSSNPNAVSAGGLPMSAGVRNRASSGVQNMSLTQQQALAQANMRSVGGGQRQLSVGQPIPGVGPGSGSQVNGSSLSGKEAAITATSSRPSLKNVSEHPPVPPEIMRSLDLDHIKSVDEWSKKLQAEGKEVPQDLKLYESIINKEIKFRSNYARQSDTNKRLATSLVQDARSYNDIKQLRMGAIQLSQKQQFNNSIWGEGYQGYGNGITNVATQLVLPQDTRHKRKLPESGRTERESNQVLLQRLLSDPNRNLVPIRIDVDESANLKLRDTFLWDLDEKDMKVEDFVQILLEDYKFVDKSTFSTIVKSIKDQIEDFNKRPDKPAGELRVPIKINVTVNNTQYTDQFEWDILNYEENDPEDFSVMLCEEMCLPGEFSTAIAHSIREQSQMFLKSLYLSGYSFDGSAVHEDEIRSHLLPPLRLLAEDGPNKKHGTLVDDYFSILRNPSNVSDYTPQLIKMTQLELERLDKELEREVRHKRRQNNEAQLSTSSRGRRAVLPRGGPTLPDLADIPKTFRTPQPSSVLPGGVDLGVPEVYTYNEVIVHRTSIPNPEYKAPLPKVRRVVYDHDEYSNRFLVKIKLGSAQSIAAAEFNSMRQGYGVNRYSAYQR